MRPDTIRANHNNRSEGGRFDNCLLLCEATLKLASNSEKKGHLFVSAVWTKGRRTGNNKLKAT